MQLIRCRSACFALLAFALVLLPVQSKAEDAAPHEIGRVIESKRPERTVAYGYELLATDLFAIALLSASPLGGSHGSGAMAAAAGVTYVVAPPVIHVAHKQSLWVASGSLLLRAGVPVGMAALGYEIGLASVDCASGSRPAFCGLGNVLGGMIGGAVLGVLTASTIDIAVLARKRVPVEDDTVTAKSDVLPFTIAPLLNVSREPNHAATTFGFSGTF